MEKSTSIKNIGLALFKFHGIVESISKDANNPAFKKDGKVSKYASLSNIQDAIRQPLQQTGLVYLQMPESGNTMATLIMHPESDEYIQGSYDLTPVSNSPQAVGSAITYARRYALAAAFGLIIDDDDDGNAASGTDKKEKKQEGVPADIMQQWIDVLKSCKTLEDVTTLYKQNEPMLKQNPTIKALFTKRKEEINGNH